jgi:hypothetical protein
MLNVALPLRKTEWEQHMADCEMIEKCIFFNDKMSDKPGTASIMKQKYCKGSNKDCARYIVCKALGRERVPSDLFPIQIDRARALVQGG